MGSSNVLLFYFPYNKLPDMIINLWLSHDVWHQRYWSKLVLVMSSYLRHQAITSTNVEVGYTKIFAIQLSTISVRIDPGTQYRLSIVNTLRPRQYIHHFVYDISGYGRVAVCDIYRLPVFKVRSIYRIRGQCIDQNIERKYFETLSTSWLSFHQRQHLASLNILTTVQETYNLWCTWW